MPTSRARRSSNKDKPTHLRKDKNPDLVRNERKREVLIFTYNIRDQTVDKSAVRIPRRRIGRIKAACEGRTKNEIDRLVTRESEGPTSWM